MTPKEFEELANIYRSRLVRYAVHKRGEEGEDAVQEAFLRAFEHLDKFDHSVAFNTWVYTIAKNILINWQKKSAPDIDSDVDVFDLADDTTPELLASGRQYAELMEQLTPAEYDALLDKMEGVVPRNRTNLVRARRKLK